MNKKQSAYAASGVDIDEMMTGLDAIKRMVRTTRGPGAMSDIGSFGGLFASPGKDHALVASTDSVGTKVKIAFLTNRHDTVGRDIVNHCVNDILVQGARPLFFLDYLGTSHLQSRVFKEIVKGLCVACRENGCTLLGGETAEMPGLYPEGEYDLVGTIVGAVAQKDIVTGEAIRPGDEIIGLPSSGLHTNGYTLARKALLQDGGLSVDDPFPGLKKTVGRVLLTVHRSYLKPVTALMERLPVRGMAHITGGGLIDNVPRILPSGMQAVIDCKRWRVPRVFTTIRELADVDPEEMYRVFNMGIGYIIVVRKQDADAAMRVLQDTGSGPVRIGRITEGQRRVRLQR